MPIVSIKELRDRLPPKSRLLGMDHGAKTLGLAFSNPELTMATPFKTLRGKKFTENLKELLVLVAEYEVKGFVIGLPINMDGTEGKRCESVRSFGQNLLNVKSQFGFDPLIAFFDERLSSSTVEDMLIEERGMKPEKRAELLDKLAAAHILQGALDEMKKGK